MAEEGRLWIVAAGADAAIERARPILELLSRGISVVGREPRQAHAVKLGGNFLIGAMIHALSEAFVYSAAQGIDPETFLETVNSALFQSPYYAAYGKVMLHPPERPGATLEMGEKDLRLLREAAAGSGTRLSLADALGRSVCRIAPHRPRRRRLGRRPVQRGAAPRACKIKAMNPKEKIVFITGASAGIGAATALAFAGEGRGCCSPPGAPANWRKWPRAHSSCGAAAVHSIDLDVRNRQAVQSAIDELPAGVGRDRHPGEQCRPEPGHGEALHGQD